ncbi:MAG: dihydroneopterin aldolase [Thiomonas sp.]
MAIQPHAAQPLASPHDLIPQPSGRGPCDTVFIRGFRGQTIIGIRDDELHQPQAVVIDVVAGRNRLSACRSDAIDDTIDYSALHAWLLGYLRNHGHLLLEAFAEGMADTILQQFNADWTQVTVVKPRKYADVEEVGVRIERCRTQTAAPQAHGAEILRLIGGGLTPGRR